MAYPPDSATTVQLLEQAAAGDPEAFARLFERQRGALRQMIGLRLEPELVRRFDASDVIQEAQLVAVRRFRDFLETRPMPFSLWIRRLALERLGNLRRTHAETGKRDLAREQRYIGRSSYNLARSLIASRRSPSESLAASEQIRQLQHALVELSEQDQEILLMRYCEGRPNGEIALLLGISEKAASKRHGAALLRLRRTVRRLFPEDFSR